MDKDYSLFFAVLFGMLLLLMALALGILVFRTMLRRPTRNPPLVPSDDGSYEVGGKRDGTYMQQLWAPDVVCSG